MRRTLPALLLTAAMLLLAVALAVAGPPPRGLYECTISGVGLFGDIRIKKDNKYVRFGKTGKFASKGRKLNFFSGPLKGFKGRWYMAEERGGVKVPEIALKNPIDEFESIYCDK